LPKCRILR